MVSPVNTNWLYDYGFEDIPVPHGNISVPDSGLNWPTQALNGSSNLSTVLFPEDLSSSIEIEGSFGEPDVQNNTGARKRSRTEHHGPSSSKACREKQRRDRLNDKFMELSSLLEPGRPPKTDKVAILGDAIHMVTQLRDEAQELKDSNLSLHERIKELKDEKNELRDEKQRLKSDKEKLEQQLKTMCVPQPGYLSAPHSIPAAFANQSQVVGNKFPFFSYPSVAIPPFYQLMPATAVDTSQDHVLRPPVA